MQSIIIALITFGILVAIHEFGHFWVARRCGVKVLRFAIGFGPVLFRWQDKLGTEYALCALPLGGYVKMLDEAESSVEEGQQHLAFNKKHPAKRIAIALAGPLANFVLAIMACWLVFVLGTTGVAPIVGKVVSNSPAHIAGLQTNDEITAIDHQIAESWQDVLRHLMLRLGETGDISVTVIRDNQSVELSASVNRWLAGVNEPDLLEGFGIGTYEVPVPAIINEVLSDSAAEKAGLLSGDEITLFNGEPVADWYNWVERIQASADKTVLLGFIRNDTVQFTSITPKAHTSDTGSVVGRAGVSVVPPKYPEAFIREFRYPLHTAFVKSLHQTYTLSVFTLESFGKLLTGLISPKNLSGPITIAKVASDSAKHGLESYLYILALLSISLGVLNLLPIPVLDGGHIVYHTIEWIKGSPVSETVQNIGLRIGVAMVLCLMLFAIVNDVTRLFTP